MLIVGLFLLNVNLNGLVFLIKYSELFWSRYSDARQQVDSRLIKSVSSRELCLH